MSQKTNELLNYYIREMDALREGGAVFAEEFPKIAGRLKLDKSDVADPHVERLFESFAFLAGRLQRNIDNVAEETTTVLLDVLYPHLMRPMPAMSIAQFQVEDHLPPASGTVVEAHSEVFAYASNGSTCRFSTVFPLTLYPIVLEKASIESRGAYRFIPVPDTLDFEYREHQQISDFFLELTLSSLEADFKDLPLDSLLFYLNMGSSVWKKQVYQAIFSSSSLAYCSRGDERVAIPLLPHSVQPVGFERDEMALPPDAHETHGFQLLQEFFHFQDKFMFFKICYLKYLHYLRKGNFLHTRSMKLLIPLNKAQSDWARMMEPTDVLLNCTPIVNLHKVTTDPISWDQKKTFYHLAPSASRDRTLEIYRILEVFAVNPDNGHETLICPYFSFERSAIADNLFWWSRFVPTRQKNIVGVDSWITFVDTQNRRVEPWNAVVYAKTLCTNRFLAEDIPQGAALLMDRKLPIDQIVCIQKPCFPQYDLEKGANNSKLLAQLTNQFLGFTHSPGHDLADQLKRLLDLHLGPSNRPYGRALLNQLQSFSVELGAQRSRTQTIGTLIPCYRYEVAFTRSQYTPDWFLLVQILKKFFDMNRPLNTAASVSWREIA